MAENLVEQAQLLNVYREMILGMYRELPFPHEDVRKALFMRLMACVSVYIRMMNLLLWGRDNPRQLEVIYGLSDPTSSAFVDATEELFEAGRLHFIVGSQFAIEFSLKALLRAIDKTNGKRKFWHITEDVLRVCEIPDLEKKHRIVNVPAFIRNGLHSNGKHTGEDCRFDVAGVTYEFRKDQEIDCATLEELAHVMTESAKVLNEIVLSESSRRVRIIEDDHTLRQRRV